MPEVAVVTGSTSGIGLASAVAFGKRGCRVVLNSRTEQGLEAALRAVRDGGAKEVQHFVGDMTNVSDISVVAHEVQSRWNRIDYWVNNASGLSKVDLFENQSPEIWMETLDGKLLAFLRCIQTVVPIMKRQGSGSIVNVVSDAGRVGTVGESIVGAAYGGMIAATKSMAREFSRYLVRINCVSVSLTRDTRRFEEVMSGVVSGTVFAKIADRMPLGVLEPDDVAHCVVLLATARRVTGQTLSVNSGLSYPS